MQVTGALRQRNVRWCVTEQGAAADAESVRQTSSFGMKDKRLRKRLHEIEESIRKVLLHDWDPIEVANEPLAQSEYDPYVGGIYRLLTSGASEKEIADHLWRIETEGMGLSRTEPSSLLPVARKLRELNIQVVNRGPAA